MVIEDFDMFNTSSQISAFYSLKSYKIAKRVEHKREHKR